MKNLCLLTLFLTSACFAKTRNFKEGSDFVKLANHLIYASTQKCIEDTGFKWNGPLTQTTSIAMEEKKEKTIYTIHINQFAIKPEDGLKLKKTDNLVIEIVPVQTRAGKTQSIKCSLI